MGYRIPSTSYSTILRLISHAPPSVTPPFETLIVGILVAQGRSRVQRLTLQSC